MIAIVNYGAGNIRSVQNMLARVGAATMVASSAADLARASKVIIPGVGSFDAGMGNLEQSGLLEALDSCRRSGMPVLGICLGAQLLGRKSEEGLKTGLAWIEMDIVRFKEGPDTKVPHMGWREVSRLQDHPLVSDLPDDVRFYFVHSYHMRPDDTADALLMANYGGHFVAAVARDNVMGVQFHPEKSHKFGMRLLQNFVRMPS